MDVEIRRAQTWERIVAFVDNPVEPHEVRGIVVLLKSGKSSQL